MLFGTQIGSKQANLLVSYNKQMPTLFILKLESLSGGDFFVYNWMPSDKVLDQSWRTDSDFK